MHKTCLAESKGNQCPINLYESVNTNTLNYQHPPPLSLKKINYKCIKEFELKHIKQNDTILGMFISKEL